VRVNLSNPRTVIAIVVIAVLVLAGAGIGIYLLAKDDAEPSAAGGTSSTEQAPTTPDTSTSAVPAPPSQTAAPGSSEDMLAARNVAEQAIAAINERNAEAMKKISCDPESVESAEEIPPDARAELTADPELSGDRATAQVAITVSGQSSTVPMPLLKKNGTWCVD
jgi:hypothetical protein